MKVSTMLIFSLIYILLFGKDNRLPTPIFVNLHTLKQFKIPIPHGSYSNGGFETSVRKDQTAG
jgi:hypothetical protein